MVISKYAQNTEFVPNRYSFYYILSIILGLKCHVIPFISWWGASSFEFFSKDFLQGDVSCY